MTVSSTDLALLQQWNSLEPYAQLLRALLPRATGVAVFDGKGELRWSSESAIGSDVESAVKETVARAERDSAQSGELQVLEGNVPLYLAWLRNVDASLMAVVAIQCRPGAEYEVEARPFSLVGGLIRPALECLRRDLSANATIRTLNRTVNALDRDIQVLLPEQTQEGDAGTGPDELKAILNKCADHLQCSLSALIVPEKGIVQMSLGSSKAPDNQYLARTHRQLLSMAKLRGAPVIINRVAARTSQAINPYRILSCPVHNLTGRVVGVLALFRDQTLPEFVERDARVADILARKAAAAIAASYDALSGLYTRQAFELRLRALTADIGRAGKISALYIDSDQLHVINDNFGMHVGDSVIAQLGELIRRRLPPGGIAARISGDRFAALLPTGIHDAQRFAEALREGAEQLCSVHGDARLHVSISIGVAELDKRAHTELAHALATAETACKAAKDRGRNRVEVYELADQSIVRRFADINVSALVRSAIKDGRLRVYAQMIQPLQRSGHAKPHFEILLRMIDDEGKTIGPDGFLSAANRYQLMPTIDRWVVTEVIAQLTPHAALLGNGAVSFAINFSGQSLNDDDFSDFLFARLGKSGIPPEVFCFELTENATIGNMAKAEEFMRKLRKLGCGVALDDFGTGLSSLAYLRRLPATMLKIDGSFIRDILRDARSESMVQAIAQLARGMSLTTVAEYVETDEIRNRVAALGVDYGQGFAIGRPLPLEELLSDLPLLMAADPILMTADDPDPKSRVVNLH